jgi:hypothetical protein
MRKAISPRLGINKGGLHAAEGLLLARYFMFTQVYFHKTRVAYDRHLQYALKEMLPGGIFPKPVEDGLAEYLQWDDWGVLGLLAEGKGGEDGTCLATRKHFREIAHTPEVPSKKDLARFEEWRNQLKDFLVIEKEAQQSWYREDSTDIPVALPYRGQKSRPSPNTPISFEICNRSAR